MEHALAPDPRCVFASLVFFKQIKWRTKTFYAWVGLRGATPIVFALIPVVAKVPEAMKILNIAFIIVIVSIVVQGTTVAAAAKITDSGKLKEKRNKQPADNQNIYALSKTSPLAFSCILGLGFSGL